MWQRSWLGIVVLVAGAAVPAQGQVTLAWKWKEGDTVYLESVTKMKQAMKFAGQAIDTENENTNVDSFKVEKKTGDLVVLKRTIESAKAKVQGPGADMAEKMTEGLKGTTLTIHLMPTQRKVTKLEGLETMIEKAFGANPLMRQVMGAALSEEAVTSSMEDLLVAYLPEGPVKPGDKWKRQYKVSLGPLGSLAADGEYTYVGKADVNGKKLDKIELVSKLTFQPPKKGVAGLPFEVSKSSMKFDQFKGTYWFDAEAGKLAQMETGFTGKGSMTVSAMGQEIEIEIDQEQSTKGKVLEKAPAQN